MVAFVGGVYGFVEAVRDYPLSSWFGVTLYVALLGTVAGFVLGTIAGAVRQGIGRPRRPR